MKTFSVMLLIGLVGLLAIGLSAAEKSTKGTQPVYRVRVTGDTVWFFGKTFKQPLEYSTLSSRDSTEGFFFEGRFDTLWVTGGPDTAVVLPTTESIRFWFCSVHDSVLQTWPCAVLMPDTLKVDLLKKYSKFGQTVPETATSFVYQPATDSNLVRLRTEFPLDSIAGNGDEFSRERNLLRWVHKRIRHQGVNSTNPSPANAEHIIEVCDKENRGVNCRMLATTLNEVYLAMGFKSRHLTCMPYDTLDNDCHVIDMVWSTQYSKWLYMDPTYEAYWMDTRRVPLSPWQVRQAILNGDSLVVSDSINWNGQPHARMDYYNYMAKNLFRFSCPTVSAFGYESRDTVGHIWLAPTLYNPRLLGTMQQTATKGRTSLYTDNADWFFAPPK